MPIYKKNSAKSKEEFEINLSILLLYLKKINDYVSSELLIRCYKTISDSGNNMPKQSKKSIEIRNLRLRTSLWPDASRRIWDHKKSDGWLNIPRTMPIILRIIDSLSKGQPVSSTYLDLWCRTFNNGFVTANRQREMSFFSGFDGERAQRTWLTRIKKLEELGFIDVQEGPSGAVSYILIENPYNAIKKLYDKELIYEKFWNALIARMTEIGANEIDDLVEIKAEEL